MPPTSTEIVMAIAALPTRAQRVADVRDARRLFSQKFGRLRAAYSLRRDQGDTPFVRGRIKHDQAMLNGAGVQLRDALAALVWHDLAAAGSALRALGRGLMRRRQPTDDRGQW